MSRNTWHKPLVTLSPWVKIPVTVGALALVILSVWPVANIEVDWVTFAFALLAVFPWLIHLVARIELPGGTVITVNDLRNATEDLVAQQPAAEVSPTLYEWLLENDPNLALAKIRIEIEKRVRQLARAHDIGPEKEPLGSLIRRLASKGILEPSAVRGLEAIVHYANMAVHGAEVERNVASWVLDEGVSVIAFLDNLIRPGSNAQTD